MKSSGQSFGHILSVGVGAVLILGIIGFVIFYNAKKQDAPVKPVSNVVISWSDRIDEITALAQKAFPDEMIGERGAITIETRGDVTGDGVEEAFIDLGTGGASSRLMSLVRIENGTAKIAQMKDIDGVTRPLLVNEGGAVLHQDIVGMSVVDRMIYQQRLFVNAETGAVSSCMFEAYIWNSRTEVFVYNPDVSLSLQASYCIPE
jgi:hypothetical protein